MEFGIQYNFVATVWQHSAPGGWYFVSLPTDISAEIRGLMKTREEGWGRLKATAKVGSTTWGTAIWFDTKIGTYLLPLKAQVRQAEAIESGQELDVVIWI